MKTKVLLILALTLLYGFRVWQMTGCQSFNSFRINPLTVKIAVESQRLIDTQSDAITPRIYHNKITTGIFENAKNFLAIFNLNLLIAILGPAGLFATIYLLANIKKGKNPLIWLHVVYIFLSSLALTIFDPKVGFYNFALSLYTFSFWLVFLPVKKTYVKIFLLILIIISFWYYSLDWQMKTICNEIFFS